MNSLFKIMFHFSTLASVLLFCVGVFVFFKKTSWGGTYDIYAALWSPQAIKESLHQHQVPPHKWLSQQSIGSLAPVLPTEIAAFTFPKQSSALCSPTTLSLLHFPRPWTVALCFSLTHAEA